MRATNADASPSGALCRSGSLLGTAIFELGSDDRPALLASDLHVSGDGGAVLESLSIWVEQAIVREARLFLLGDLFDSYVTPAQLRFGVYREVTGLLAKATAGGVGLWVLHGNRDFLLGAEFERATGGRVVPGGVRCRLAGRTALLLHGDELCQNDLPYLRAKRWLRHPVTCGLARRLPLRMARWAADRARRKSRRVIQGAQRSGDQARFAPTAAAIGQAFATGCQQVIFGHIHDPARGCFPGTEEALTAAATGSLGAPVEPPAGGEYLVLPAFDRQGVGLLADADAVRYVRTADGRELVAEPDPPPRRFP